MMTAPEVHESVVERPDVELAELRESLARTTLRLERLERRTRRISALALIASVSLAAGIPRLTAQSNPIQPGRFKTPFEVVDPGGRTILSVETGDSGTGFVRIGNPNTGGLTFGVGASGAGFLLLRNASGADQVTIGQAGGGPMAVRVMSTNGATTLAQLGIDSQGRGLLTVGDPGAGGIWTGAGASGSGFFILRNPKGQNAIAIGQREGRPMAVSVMNASGDSPIAEFGTDSTGAGHLAIRGADGTSTASIGKIGDYSLAFGLGEAKNPDAALGMRQGLVLLNVGRENAGSFAAGEGKSGAGFAVVRNDAGKMTIGLGHLDGRPAAVHVFGDSADEPVASLGRAGSGTGGALSVAQSAGSTLFQVSAAASPGEARVTIGPGAKDNVAVTVANSSKAAVASFGEAAIGGGVFVANSASGTTRALLSGSVGELHVADESGATRAAVVAASKGGGALAVRNAGGTMLVRLGEGNQGGMMQLANTGGNATVEAGTLPDGVGVVRAYPLGNPALGMIGMPGTFIMGFGGKK